MDRRSFLKFAGSSCMSGLFLTQSSFAQNTGGNTDQNGIAIDKEELQYRNQNRSTVVSQNGMICTSQPLATMTGIDTLRAGGNAIDAAIAANAVLSVVEPMSCGPGGDLFAIVWIEKEKKLYGLNASGRSPFNWSLEKANKLGLKEIPTFGSLSWSVPGCVSGWDALSTKFGKLAFKDLFAAAINYSHEGFPVSPVIARGWNSVDFANYPSLAKVYAPDGMVPQFGDIFRNADMGSFFEMIAKDGADTFYKGDIAEQIVKYSQKNEGLFSMRDFSEHTVSWVEPVSSDYRGYDVWELPPNGQGIAALQILNILENFDIGSLEPNSAEHLHIFLEAKKLAFEDRAVYYADMDKADVPVDWLISKEYGRERSKLINTKKASVLVTPGNYPGKSDTIYLTTSDADGNMVSLIQSVYWSFGSRMVPDGLGFALQNRGKLFALDPNHRNRLEPHKRPFHTIIPAFVSKNEQPVFSFGVMGGDFQPQGHAQVLMNIIDFKMSPQQAGEQPRIAHYESSTPMGDKMKDGGEAILERFIDDKTRQKLEEMGHTVLKNHGAFGGYQGIWRKENPRRYFGGSDSRKDGCAIGY
jgi:gamma-glutamyltranspeptidase / glutathione hydrolase